MKTVNVREAKTQLSRLLERAHAGEEIIIAKGLVGLRRPGLPPWLQVNDIEMVHSIRQLE